MEGKVLMISLVVLAAALFGYGQDDESEAVKKEKCKNLNEMRANFTSCCKYPIAVVLSSQHLKCKLECAERKKDKNCCVNACLYRLEKILTYVNKTETSPAEIKISYGGLIVSFMRSVQNDKNWHPVVSTSVQKCFNHFVDQDLGNKCDLVPKALLEMIDCSYEQNFLNCPPIYWNQKNVGECAYTREYVDLCMDGIRFRSQH